MNGVKSKVFGANAKTVIDSGTSFILMPLTERTEWLNHLEKHNGFKCQDKEKIIAYCSWDNYDDIPDLIFTIGGKEYVVPREQWIMKPVDFMDEGYVMIMGHPFIPFWIMGLNFFHNYYTVFDNENQRVGFALSKTANPRILDIIKERSAKMSLIQEYAVENVNFIGISAAILLVALTITFAVKKYEGPKQEIRAQKRQDMAQNLQ